MEEQLNLSDSKAENFGYQKIVLAVGITLMAVKFAAWLLTDSVSILTDALESIVNVVAAAIGLYALYLSAQPRDENHPFGHGKIENISSLIEGSMICVAGALILLQAVERIIDPKKPDALDIGLILIVSTAVVNYVTGYYAIAKGRRNRSPALTASGKHLCSDTYSSVGIVIGLGAMMGLEAAGIKAYWLDGAIASVFGIIILITGIRVVKDSMDSSMDKADEVVVDNILSTLKENRHCDWIDIHNLRVIKYGALLHIQMHVVLPRRMTIEEQRKEFDELRESINAIYGDSVDIIVMGDPCTDVFCRYCDRECDLRAHQFVRLSDWTHETIVEEDTSVE